MSAREAPSKAPELDAKKSQQTQTESETPTMGILDSAGLNAPSAKFPTVGTKVGGEIVEILPERQANEYRSDRSAPAKPKTFPNGDPVMEYPHIIQLAEFTPVRATDVGRRGFYAQKSTGLYKAIVNAARAVGRNPSVGDYLEVELVAEVPGKGSVDKKIYAGTLYPKGTWEHLFPKSTGQSSAPASGILGSADDDDDRELVGAGAASAPASRPQRRAAAAPPSGNGAV